MTEELKVKTQKTKAEAAIAEVVVPQIEEIVEETNTGDKIGSILKQARLGQGKKIPEISQILCIRKAYLEAIEENDYEKIPEFPYGIGFIRSYADYLGLDSSLIIKKYKEEAEGNNYNDNQCYIPEPQTEATVPGKKYLLISLVAIIAVYLIWFFMYNGKENNENYSASTDKVVDASEDTSAEISQFPLVVEDYAPAEAELDKNSEEVLKVIEPAPLENAVGEQVTVNEGSFNEQPSTLVAAVAVSPEPAVVSKTDASAQASKLGKSNVVLKIKKETWVEVKTTDKLFISKVLQAGESYAIPKGNGMILSVGRLDGVEVIVDGKQVNVLPTDRKTNIALDEILNNQNH